MKNIMVLTLLVAIVLMACKKTDHEETTTPPFTKGKIDGVSQKGPFLNGSSVTAFELDENFAQTGKSFNTQISDNLGSFELDNISLLTHYIKLKADGYYFNEVQNSNSLSSVSLYALSDLSDKSTVNVNLLSTLEVSRVEYLMSTGSTFNHAKHQAQQEILNIFSIHKSAMAESELLNIAVNSDDNAVLLAISIILQGYRTEAGLTQLLGNINTDIRTDGILNSSSLGSSLINDVRLLNLEQIRTNLTNKFQTLGLNDSVPNFEKYIHVFLDSTQYVITNNIVYPEFSNYGENILYNDKDTFSLTGIYSMAANLPAGTTIKIIIKYPIAGWGYYAIPYPPVNWTVTIFDYVNHKQIFTSIVPGVNCDLKFVFQGVEPITPTMEYYENNSPTPTKIKKIYVQ
jgi:hypothetical protein